MNLHNLYYEKIKYYDLEYLNNLISEQILIGNINGYDYKNRILFLINKYREYDLKKMIEIEEYFRTVCNYKAVPSFMYNSYVKLNS